MIRHVIVKVAGTCNLACKYCYYMPDRARALQVLMPRHVMGALLEGLAAADGREARNGVVTLYWHGGEPLLQPLGFWLAVHRLQTDLCRTHGIRWENRLTTNATLVDDRMAEFLAMRHWTVNVSLDGPRAVHDRERVDRRGRGTYDRTFAGLETLRRAGIEPAVFSVMRDDEGAGVTLYQHYKALGIQAGELCIPVYNWHTEMDPDARSARLLAQLTTFYQAWRADARPMRVRLLDSVIHRIRCGQHLACHHAGCCTEVVTVEPTGDVYLCDDLLGMDYRAAKLGPNVLSCDFAHVADLVAAVGRRRHYADVGDDCHRCAVYDICCGGCPATRWDGTSYVNRSAHCAIFKSLFALIAADLGEASADGAPVTAAARVYRSGCGVTDMSACAGCGAS